MKFRKQLARRIGLGATAAVVVASAVTLTGSPAHAAHKLVVNEGFTFHAAGCVMDGVAGNYGRDAYINIKMRTPGCVGRAKVVGYRAGNYYTGRTESTGNVWATAAARNSSILCVEYTNQGLWNRTTRSFATVTHEKCI